MRPVRSCALACTLSVLVLGCPRKNPGAADGGANANVEGGAKTDAGDDGGGGSSSGASEVRPVYPVDPNAPIDPAAQKLCAGLNEMPERKRAACCAATPGIVVTTECTRMLSAAIQTKAAVLDGAAVDACIAAFEKSLEGCDWVGPFPPGPPAVCQGLVKGNVGIGQKCRSTLECSGALRCKGVGPTTPGKCSTPNNSGDLCGGTVDALATYVRQTDFEKEHPECAAGRCIKHRCAAPAPEGGACQVTLDCEDGLQCITSPSAARVRPKKGERPGPQRKCARRPLPKEGEACPGGVCADDLGCVLNKCMARKPGGAQCTNDFECRGGCLREDGGTKGKCGPRCDLR
jgi:hypothetical protein